MKKLLTLSFLLLTLTGFAQLKPVVYKDGDQRLNGMLIRPAKPLASKAGILILPAWKGIDAHSRQSAQKLAAAGYIAFIADIYGEGNYPTTAEEAGERSGYYKTNYQEYHNRIRAAYDQLKKAGAKNVVIIGFCFGGTGAIEAARVNFPVKGIVSFHGGLGRDVARGISTINPKLLILHGADDFYIPQEEVLAFQQEMKTAKADWQMIYYANAVHAFSDPYAGSDKASGAAYDAVAAKRSWQHMMDFLKEVF